MGGGKRGRAAVFLTTSANWFQPDSRLVPGGPARDSHVLAPIRENEPDLRVQSHWVKSVIHTRLSLGGKC